MAVHHNNFAVHDGLADMVVGMQADSDADLTAFLCEVAPGLLTAYREVEDVRAAALAYVQSGMPAPDCKTAAQYDIPTWDQNQAKDAKAVKAVKAAKAAAREAELSKEEGEIAASMAAALKSALASKLAYAYRQLADQKARAEAEQARARAEAERRRAREDTHARAEAERRRHPDARALQDVFVGILSEYRTHGWQTTRVLDPVPHTGAPLGDLLRDAVCIAAACDRSVHMLLVANEPRGCVGDVCASDGAKAVRRWLRDLVFHVHPDKQVRVGGVGVGVDWTALTQRVNCAISGVDTVIATARVG